MYFNLANLPKKKKKLQLNFNNQKKSSYIIGKLIIFQKKYNKSK